MHVLGMDVARQEQRGARVPEVVESYLGQARTLQERGERALSKVGRVDECPGLRLTREEYLEGTDSDRERLLRERAHLLKSGAPTALRRDQTAGVDPRRKRGSLKTLFELGLIAYCKGRTHPLREVCGPRGWILEERLWALGLLNPALRETIEMLYEFEEPFVVDHSAFAQAFGDHATPLREAIRSTVWWYRDERSSGE